MPERLNAIVCQGAYLPHWTKEGATYHVRFRLADSLPQHILRQWKEEKEELRRKVAREKRGLTKGEAERLQQLSSERVEKFLRAGYGACWLQNDVVAGAVSRVLMEHTGKRYRLLAWCIMPNHVHVVLEPLLQYSLSKILGTWKTVSARKANKLLKRSGDFWQVESFDHLIRNEEDFRHAVEYVWKNSEEAGLKDWKWRWKMPGL